MWMVLYPKSGKDWWISSLEVWTRWRPLNGKASGFMTRWAGSLLIEHANCSTQYLPQDLLNAGIKAGKLHQGHFNTSQYNYLEGFVNVPSLTKSVLLVGREAMNRSVQGDLVVVEIFPKAEWKAPGEEVVDADRESFC